MYYYYRDCICAVDWLPSQQGRIDLNKSFLYLCASSVGCVCALERRDCLTKKNTVDRTKQLFKIAHIPNNFHCTVVKVTHTYLAISPYNTVLLQMSLILTRLSIHTIMYCSTG